MKLKHIKRIALAGALLSLLLLYLAEQFNLPLLAGFSVLLLIGALLFQFCLYRCPHCGRSLARKRGWWDEDEYCPRCGKKVTEDDTI